MELYNNKLNHWTSKNKNYKTRKILLVQNYPQYFWISKKYVKIVTTANSNKESILIDTDKIYEKEMKKENEKKEDDEQ